MRAATCSTRASMRTKSGFRCACRARIGRGFSLDLAEALLEFAICFTQRGFRIDIEMPCEVYHGEQQVAHLLEHARVLGFRLKFGELLVDLGARTAGIGPVEADPG